MAGGLTDAKGNRKLKPHRVVERREDGIVVKGAKVMIAGTAASEEIFILPGTAHKKESAEP